MQLCELISPLPVKIIIITEVLHKLGHAQNDGEREGEKDYYTSIYKGYRTIAIWRVDWTRGLGLDTKGGGSRREERRKATSDVFGK